MSGKYRGVDWGVPPTYFRVADATSQIGDLDHPYQRQATYSQRQRDELMPSWMRPLDQGQSPPRKHPYNHHDPKGYFSSLFVLMSKLVNAGIFSFDDLLCFLTSDVGYRSSHHRNQNQEKPSYFQAFLPDYQAGTQENQSKEKAEDRKVVDQEVGMGSIHRGRV